MVFFLTSARTYVQELSIVNWGCTSAQPDFTMANGAMRAEGVGGSPLLTLSEWLREWLGQNLTNQRMAGSVICENEFFSQNKGHFLGGGVRGGQNKSFCQSCRSRVCVGMLSKLCYHY